MKIFSEPMPGSNERSIQLIGGVDAMCECVRSFLDDISKVLVPISTDVHGGDSIIISVGGGKPYWV